MRLIDSANIIKEMARKQIVKKPKKLEVKPAVKAVRSKPAAAKLSKADPDYYSKIGAISAQKRKISSEQFSEMAKKSHPRPASGYRGGRKKKVAGSDDTALDQLGRDLRSATNNS